jgi:glycosyltransferase involved in cell wall biosynthesis
VAGPGFSYALVTPARDEAENLRRLGTCLLGQSLSPHAWVIVDNGSSDETPDVARELAQRAHWIRVLELPGGSRATPGAPIVKAFRLGFGELSQRPDVIVKLDADVSMEPDYFERLLCSFASDPKLGIASGACFEQTPDGWAETFVTGQHVRGAARAYRRECLEAIWPLEERMGWDSLDGLKANVLGWETRLLRDLRFFHHRRVGERDDGKGARWSALGGSSHYMGYRFSYLLIRALYQARRDPAALRMVTSYLAATLRREPRYADLAVRRQLRQEQTLRKLPLRFRESRGRRAS